MSLIKILSIEKKERSKKFKIITDENEYLVSEDMIVKHLLFKDKTFTKKEFDKIIKDILENEYFNKCINLLSFSSKSQYEIYKYIETTLIKNKEKLDNKQVENIINKLKQFNYIDDEKLCNSLIDYYIRNNKGPLYIKQKLKEKRIDDFIITNNLSRYNSNIEEEIIIKIINKNPNKEMTIKKYKMSLYNKLLRNGFSSSLIYKHLDQLDVDDNSDVLIEKDFLKAYNKVIKKDKTDSEKKQLIINNLLSKGYEYKLIKKHIDNKF